MLAAKLVVGSGRSLERRLGSIVRRPQIAEFTVANEPVLGYLAGSKERAQLESDLRRTASVCEDVPIVVAGEEIREGTPRCQPMPHDHSRHIARYYYASEKTIQRAIDSCVEAQKSWDRVPLETRIGIFMKAADMMAVEHRASLLSATMLGQSKTVVQAEIDAAPELIDFLRFNAYFAKENAKYQPISEDPKTTLNSMRFRGLEGFVAAISPFNFTAIGGNLAYAPALMGCAVVWKPSDTAVLSNWRVFNIMRRAGIPDGVVNFVPADGPAFGRVVTSSPHLAGLNFTGSVPTFNWLWTEVGKNVARYRNYPRLIGECGGKNYHFVHPSADVRSVVTASVRSAFEYCGQKCSALARLYVPQSLCEPIVAGLKSVTATLKVSDPCDFSSFMGAVIDEKAFDRISGYIERARRSPRCTILAGGQFDKSKGFFIQPTVIATTDPLDELMTEEIFGPVLTMYVYKDEDLMKTLDLVGSSTAFALTGSVFAKDVDFLNTALAVLQPSAGNFYVNDKSTGSVVGQQPFGGARMSGTNDKAGGPNYVMRWTSPQSIKETFVPLRDVDYPYMRDSRSK